MSENRKVSALDGRETSVGARPKRMRGFYRAVKRGEKWAVEIDRLKGLQRLIALYFRNVDLAEIIRHENYLGLSIMQNDSWKGGTLIVPFKGVK